MCTRAAQHDQTHKVLTTDQKKLDFVANFQQKVQNPKLQMHGKALWRSQKDL